MISAGMNKNARKLLASCTQQAYFLHAASILLARNKHTSCAQQAYILRAASILGVQTVYICSLMNKNQVVLGSGFDLLEMNAWQVLI